MNTAITDSGAPRGGAVVITGASTGIGRACALSLDALGFRVFAGVRKPEDGESLRRASSARLTPVFIDVTDEQSIAAAAEEVSREVGDAGLAGLVNNAGIAIPGPLEYLPLEELRRQLEINLVGQLAVTQAFLPLLRKARGRIVNVSSLAGKLTTPFNGAYSAAKHGIEAFSDALRMELASWGIHVSVVEPGTIATAMPKKLLQDAATVLNNLPAEGRERYGSDFETYVRTLAEHAQSGSQPEVVARAMVHALTARTPRARYPAGAPAGRIADAVQVTSGPASGPRDPEIPRSATRIRRPHRAARPRQRGLLHRTEELRFFARTSRSSKLTPILTPTDPNRSRLRPTRLDEDPLEIRVRKAFSDMTRHPDPPQSP